MGRRLLLFLLAVLALPALALAAGTDPRKQINPADQRKAASIVLKRTDFVPGWKKVPNTPDGGDHSCPGYNPDESDLILTGEVDANFEGTEGVPMMRSFSNVYTTTSDALASWTRSMTPALVRCVALAFKEGIKEGGAKAVIVKQGKIAFPKFAPRTAAYRVVASVSFTEAGKTRTVPFTMHVIALGNGRGDTGLMTMGLGNGIPSADLRAFAKLLAGRLAAAKL